MTGLKQSAWYFVARRHSRPVARLLARAARGYIGAYENAGSFHLDLSGERRVLEKLATAEPYVAFDVGANVGDWSLLAAKYFPAAEIHAFEVAPSTASKLTERVRHEPRIHVNSFGLADVEAMVEVNVPRYSPRSSFVVGVSGRNSLVEQGRILPGDAYAVTNGIDHIDFLKIDTEGADHLVLDGFKGLLAAGAIDVIQFEYGQFALSTRFLLADFYSFLEGFGFRVGKIYPSLVEFRSYRVEDEDFRGLNYIAVRSERTDIVRRLGRR